VSVASNFWSAGESESSTKAAGVSVCVTGFAPRIMTVWPVFGAEAECSDFGMISDTLFELRYGLIDQLRLQSNEFVSRFAKLLLRIIPLPSVLLLPTLSNLFPGEVSGHSDDLSERE
jgi:hypothetical protein